jgi:hypothetical protein
LALVGNPQSAPDQVHTRLRAVAKDVLKHLAVRHAEGAQFAPGVLGDQMLRMAGGGIDPEAPEEDFSQLVARLAAAGSFVLTQDLSSAVRGAEIVVTATSATGSVLAADDLRPGAVVCDLSRPANISQEAAARRPDVLVIDGGVIAAPGRPWLGSFGLDHGLAYACMAETMMLALEGRYENTSLGTDLSPETLRLMRSMADRHGFHVARLRSFGRVLADSDWRRLATARCAAMPAPAAKSA